MKDSNGHIAPVTVKQASTPFFQREADETGSNKFFNEDIQAKLTVGQKDDPYEKEADAMADSVVNNSNGVQAKFIEGEKGVQRQVQRPQVTILPKLQAKCDECEKEDKEEEHTEDTKVQRMNREVEEGDRIFRAESGTPDVSGMNKRDAVVAMAKSMLGKIKAKQGQGGGDGRQMRVGGDLLWEIFKLAAPDVWAEDIVKYLGPGLPSWCGIFAVWAHKKAGVNLGNWKMGRGVSNEGTLKQTTSPSTGDIGYIDQPYQHHCIVVKVNGDSIISIDGNSGAFSEVIETTRSLKDYTGFFTAFSGGDGGKVQKEEEEENEAVQSKSEGGSRDVSSSIESTLRSSKGGGVELSKDTRSEMERSMGADFGDVKIHTDNTANKLSKDLNAQAFTHGSDVYFGENKFNPGSTQGKHLLAHELTHTIQQGAAVQKTPEIQKGPLTADEVADKLAIKITEWNEASETYRDQKNYADSAYAKRVELLLFHSDSEYIDNEDLLEGYIEDCEILAEDEYDTIDAIEEPNKTLAFDATSGFPIQWSDLVYEALYLEVDMKSLDKEAKDEWKKVEDEGLKVPDGIMEKGLPVGFDDAFKIKEFPLGYNWAHSKLDHAIVPFAKAGDKYLKRIWISSFYLLWNGIAEEVADAVQRGELVVGPLSYYEFIEKKQQGVQDMAGLMAEAADEFTLDKLGKDIVALKDIALIQGFVSGLLALIPALTHWRHVRKHFSDVILPKTDAIIKGKDKWDKAGIAFRWAYENGYFAVMGERIWAGIKEHGWEILLMAILFIGVQFVPGLNIAVDVIILIHSGIDAVKQMLSLKDTFEKVGEAKDTIGMQRASAILAKSLTADGLKLLLDFLAIVAATKAIKIRAAKIKAQNPKMTDKDAFAKALKENTSKGGKVLEAAKDSKSFLAKHNNSSLSKKVLAYSEGDLTLAEKFMSFFKKAADADPAVIDQMVAKLVPDAKAAIQKEIADVLKASPNLLLLPRTTKQLQNALKAAGKPLSFESTQALRQTISGFNRVPFVSASKESLLEFLETIWNSRKEIIDKKKSVYSFYRKATEANPLSKDPKQYLTEVEAIKIGRPPGSHYQVQYSADRGFHVFYRAGANLYKIKERVYLNINADNAPQVMDHIVKNIIDHPSFPGVVGGKVTGPLGVSARPDAIVIYVEDAATASKVLETVGTFKSSNPANFKQTVPSMTQQVSEGVSVAKEPYQTSTKIDDWISFGESRSNAINEALVDTVAKNGSKADFVKRVEEVMPKHGIDPNNPHLNAPSPPPPMQPKLEVGQKDDPQEKEADAMAETVVQKMDQEPEEDVQKKSKDTLQMKCDGCEDEEKANKKDEEEDKISPFTTEKFPNNGNTPFEQQLKSTASNGHPMDSTFRQKMESGFHADFSNVRIHTDKDSANLNKQINAQAFTHGKHIYFNENKYNPGSTTGKKLIAHELTHTIQQGASVKKKVQKSDDPAPQPAPAPTPAPTASTAATPAAQAPTPAPATPPASTTAYIIDDNVAAPEAGQMKKTTFITSLKTKLVDTAKVVFKGTPYLSYLDTHLGPQVDAQFAKYTATQVEDAMKREVPAGVIVTNAETYITELNNRFKNAAEKWLTEGRLEGLPDYLVNLIPPEVRAMGPLNKVLIPVWQAGAKAMEMVQNMGAKVSEAISEAGEAVVSTVKKIGSAISSLWSKKENGSSNSGNASPAEALSHLGKGQKLDTDTRTRMESVFHEDFSNVKMHTDANASGFARNIDSKAFAVGDNIAFGNNQYKPGTIIGDALLAHELAHVSQQRNALSGSIGTGNEAAIEKDADRGALSAVSKLWGRGKEVMGELGGFLGMKSGLRVSTCGTEMVSDEKLLEIERKNKGKGDDGGIPGGGGGVPDKDYSLEELIYMLDQLNEYTDLHKSAESDHRTAVCTLGPSMGNPRGGSPGPALNAAEKSGKITAAMQKDPATFPQGMTIHELELMFLIKFKEKAQKLTLDLLQANKDLIQAEKDSALVSDPKGRVANLFTELAPVRAIGEQIEEQNELNRQNRKPNDPTLTEHDKKIEVLKKQAMDKLLELAHKYPVLADPEVSGANVQSEVNPTFPVVSKKNRELNYFNRLLFGDASDLSTTIEKVSDERLENIKTTEEGIKDDPARIFMLERIVQLTKDSIGVKPGSIHASIIDAKVSNLQMEQIFKNVAVAALGIGLAVLSGGAGTVALIASLGSLGLSAAQLYESINRYRFESAAAATSYDRAQAVAAEAGSPLWIALDVVGVVGDFAGAVKAVKGIAEAAEAARVAKASAESMEKLSQSVGKVAPDLVNEGTIKTAKQLEEAAAEAVRKQIAQEKALADPANVAALEAITKALPKNADDTAKFGLLQIEEGLRGKILKSFDPDVVLNIGHASQRSTAFRTSLHNMAAGLGDDVFNKLMPTIMRQQSGQNLLEVMHGAGISIDDLKKIDFSKVDVGYYVKFRDSVMDMLGKRLGADLDDIELLGKTIDSMNPSQRRAIMVRFIEQQANLPKELKAQIVASADLQQMLRNHGFNTEQMLKWWNEFNTGGSKGTFVAFVEGKTGLKFSGKVNPTLTDFFSNLPPNASHLEKNLALLGINEPRLVTAIKEGTLPQPLGPRLKAILENPELLGQARTVSGGKGKVIEAVNEAIAKEIKTPQDLQRVMQLINEPGSRGSIGEFFAKYHLLSPTGGADIAHVGFSAKEIPGLTVDPFRPDFLRTSSRRTLDIKAGYEATTIDLEQARNYQRLIDESRKAGSEAQKKINELMKTSSPGLAGHDYMFVSGPGGKPKDAAEAAFKALDSSNLLRDVRVLFQDMDGTIKQIVKNATGLGEIKIGSAL